MSKNRKQFTLSTCSREYEDKENPGKTKKYYGQLGSATVFSDTPLPDDLSISVELSHMPREKIYTQLNDFKNKGQRQDRGF